MKRLLGLLGTIIITGNTIPTVIAAAPNRKQSTKTKLLSSELNYSQTNNLKILKRNKRQNNENISTTPKEQDDQQAQFLANSDSKVDIIEKEITLNENYSDNIQKMIREFVKNNQIDPLRMVNNEGIITTDYFETPQKQKERKNNIKIIEELDKILELSKFDESKIRILVLTLKNKKNNEIKLIINLDNFYLQGFINKNNQYFYFKEEKNFNEWQQEIEKLKEELNEWNKINEEIKLLDLKKLNNNQYIIKKIDEIKEILKKQWGGEKWYENKGKIDLLNKNLFYEIQEDSESIDKLNELKKNNNALNKEKIYIGKIQEELNVYQKIQQIRQKSISLLNKGKLKEKNKKEYEENIKIYQWDSIFNEISSIIKNKINTIQHKKIKENKINEEIIKKYSTTENTKNKLNYNGSYQNKGLNTVNQSINFTKGNLNDAIKNLAIINNENKQNQTIKDDLARIIFITSEFMRFGSYLHYFNYEKNGKQVQFKNISNDIQIVINSTNDYKIQWKDYSEQLIGGWVASSKYLEEKRKKIFKNLKIEINTISFILKNSKKLNEILEKSLTKKQNWEKTVKVQVEQIIDDYYVKEKLEKQVKETNNILKYFKEIFEVNEKKIKNTGIYKSIYYENSNDYKEFVIMGDVILKNNLDIFMIELFLIKKPELANKKYYNNSIFNSVTSRIGVNLDIVKLLIDYGSDIVLDAKTIGNLLHLAIIEGNLELFKLLIEKVKKLYKNDIKKFEEFINKPKENDIFFKTPLHIAVSGMPGMSPSPRGRRGRRLEIVKELLKEPNIDVNIKDINGDTPLHIAAKNKIGDEITKELLKQPNIDVNVKNKDGDTPLHIAAVDEFGEGSRVAKELLKQPNIDVNVKNKDGYTILNIAIRYINLAIIKELLNHPSININVNIQDNIGQTPLHIATQKGHLKVIRKLLNHHNINVNIQDNIGQTPLHIATQKGHLKVIRKLLNHHNINVNIQDKRGKVPLNYAIENGQIEIKNLLENFQNLKNKIELFKKQLKKPQNKEQITKIENDLQESQKELEALLQPANNEIRQNQSTKSNSNNNTNVSGYQSQDSTSETQNQKIRVTNQNNLYDVPADGSCLFWAVATAYLLPVRNNNEEFRARFIQLFDNAWLDKLQHVQKLLQNYNLENNDNNQLWYKDKIAQELVRTVFRNRLVDYMNSRLDTITNNGSELTFRNLIQESNEITDNYLERMRDINSWGGTPEIIAISNFLNANISVNNDNSYWPINQNATNIINIFHVNGNHFNFALSENTSQSVPTNGTNVSVNKPINKNIENLQTTTTKAINKYNTLSKAEKQQKLNEINQHYQNLSENDKKNFKDKLTAIGTSAIGAGISAVGTKITVSGSASGAAVSTGEAMEMTPLLSEGLTAAETLSVTEGTAVVATEGAVIGAEAGTAAALAPETLGLSLVIGGLAIAGTTIIWWLSGHDNTQAVKHESHNQYNEIEKYYKFLAHDQLKLDININEWNKIKQIYQENSNNYQKFKNKIKSEITNFHKEDHSGWGGSITDNDIDALIKLIYNHFQEINNHFSSNPNHGWKIVTNTIGSYFMIEEE